MCKSENQIEAKKLYEMKLHETITVKAAVGDFFITRAIGGWIYNYPRLDSGQMNTVFVPWNNEMQ